MKFQGILLQLAEGVQGFAPHQLAKGVMLGLSCYCPSCSVVVVLCVLQMSASILTIRNQSCFVNFVAVLEPFLVVQRLDNAAHQINYYQGIT